MNENTYFRIHLEQEPKKSSKTSIFDDAKNPPPPLTRKTEIVKEHNFKTVLLSGLKQFATTVTIFAIGFLIINGSAYYKIAENKWKEYMGTKEDSSLSQLVEEKTTSPLPKNDLNVSNNLDLAKMQIPPLNLEITPIDDRIIIPRIDQNLPVVRVSSESLLARDWNALESDIQKALQDGVVHYPGTAYPGDGGNVVITGHSSYFPWDPGRFKDVFALLHEVVKGDKIMIYYQQRKYIYEVTEIKVTLPKDIEVLQPTDKEQLTLITCTPVGTNLKRLIVIAKPLGVEENKAIQR